MKYLNFTRFFKLLLPSLAVSSLSVPLSYGDITLNHKTDDVKLAIGGRVQFYTILNDDEFSADNDIEFKVRRARFRFKASKTDHLQLFLQTELTDDASGNGADMRLVDAWTKWKFNTWAQVYTGIHMVGSSRQNVTSIGALMALDRPGQANYALTWGLKGKTALQTGNIPGTTVASGYATNSVRDRGITLFGSGKLSDSTHLKYYLGLYEGSSTADNSLRQTVRMQINFGDAEKGYFNSSTYLGKKSTIGLGFSIDSQSKSLAYSIEDDPSTVGIDESLSDFADYSLISVDAFYEKPLGNGTLTSELAFTTLDLSPLDESHNLGRAPANQASGSGYYFQAGYYINKWQPFMLIEDWSADADGDVGSWSNMRLGVNYYYSGHKANVKLAYENTSPKADGVEDISTIIFGLFATF